MKKLITSLSLIYGSVLIAQAQVTFGGTIDGTPVSVSFGQTSGGANGSQILGLLALAQTLLNRMVPFLIGLALVVFFWYLVVFLWKGGQDPEAKNTSLKGMGYSILAIFVMVSIWGIISLIGNITGISQGGSGDRFAPKLPGQR